ncbi:MAG: nuclear transport factor 2 family protein [Chryseolinea sp.]
MKRITLLMLLISATAICNAQSKQNARLEEARKAIASSNAIYSDLALKNDGSILSRYSEDACILPPNAPALCGQEGILKFFKETPPVHGKFTTLNVYGDGNEYVTEEGLYEIFDLNGKKLDDGKVLVLWKKTQDGWKMYRDMFSSSHQPIK